MKYDGKPIWQWLVIGLGLSIAFWGAFNEVILWMW